MFTEFDATDKVIGGAGLTGLAVYLIQKLMTFWKTETSAQAGASATAEQFKALQAAIASNREEITVLRNLLQTMETQVHRQQTRLTRTEMLLRQFSGLVKERGILVPDFMQFELEALIEDKERAAPAYAFKDTRET